MSLLGLFPGEDDNRLDELSRGQGEAPPGPGVMDFSDVDPTAQKFVPGARVLSPLVMGGAHGLASLSQLAGDATSKAFTGITQPLYESQFQYGGGMSGGVTPPIVQSPQDVQRANEQSTAKFVKQYEQDPRTNGFVSQSLFGLADVATRMAPAALAGPAAPYVAPVLVGATTGYDVKKQLQSQGVDEATAEKMALTQGAFAAAGVSVPFGVGGRLLTKLITGASTNVSFGMVERGSSAAILRDAGYDKMAEQYQPLDHQAMVTDAIMGTFFGGLAHLHSLPPSVADVALKSSETLHVEHATDGIPTTPDARADHLYNFGETMRAALNGDEPVGLRDVQTVPDPAQEAARAENAQTLGEVVRETTGEPVATPVEEGRVFTNERRSQAINDSRLYDLRSKYDDVGAPGMNAAEMSELIALQRERANWARVKGIPIRGVYSSEGANEILQDRSFSHTTFVDADDFKQVDDASHVMGDEVIAHIGETLRKFAPPDSIVEHRGGDEFLIHHNDGEAGHETVRQANDALKNDQVHAVDNSGNVVLSKRGIGLSHGTGTNEREFEQNLSVDKANRRAAGLRGGERDSAPPAADAGGVDQRFAKGSGQAGDGGSERKADLPGTEPRLDPETAEAVDAAQRAIADNPRLNIPADETTGAEPRAAADALKAALDDITNGQTDADITQVAAACFARTL